MLKVLVACGNGVGSSMIIKTKIEQVLKEMGIECDVYHVSVGQAKGEASDFDMVLVSEIFADEFYHAKDTKVIGLRNLLSDEEIKTKVSKALGE